MQRSREARRPFSQEGNPTNVKIRRYGTSGWENPELNTQTDNALIGINDIREETGQNTETLGHRKREHILGGKKVLAGEQ